MGDPLHLLFNNFAQGEVSHQCGGLVGTEFYQGTSREIINMYVRKELALERRLGLQFVFPTYNDVHNIDLPSRLYAFIGSDQSWFLEFNVAASGQSPVRCYTLDGQLMKPDGTLTRDWNETTYTFLMPNGATPFNNPAYTISSVTQLRELCFEQNNNSIVITHKNHCPVVISYDPTTTGSSWFTADYATFEGMPWLNDDISSLGKNILGDTPEQSRLRCTDGFFGGITDLNTTDTVKGVLNYNDTATVTFTHPSDDNYKFVALPSWIGAHAVVRNTNNCTVDSNVECVIRISQVTADNALTGTTIVDADVPIIVAYYLSFSIPVVGSTTKITVTSSLSPFTGNDVGTSVMMGYGIFQITDVLSDTVAYAKCITPITSGNLAAAYQPDTHITYNDIIWPRSFRTWARGAWGNNVAATYDGAVETGWPGACKFYQGRLMTASSIAETNGVWGSKVGYPYNFAPGANADEAIQERIRGGLIENITFLAGSNVLFIGTETAIFRSVSREILAPTNFTAFNSYSYGAERIQPVEVAEWYVYVEYGGRNVRAIKYNDQIDQIQGFDMTERATHVLGTGNVRQLSTRQDSLQAVLCVCEDGHLAFGKMAGAAYNANPIPAWSRFFTYNEDGSTAPIISMAVAKRLGEDQLWGIVEREVNGRTRRFVEALDTQNVSQSVGAVTTSANQIYADCSLDLLRIVAGGGTVVGTTSGFQITGLSPLEGRTCFAMVNGGQVSGITVSGGVADVPYSPIGSTITVAGTTITFNGSDASADLVGSYIWSSAGGFYRLTHYTNSTTMTATVIFGGDCTDADWNKADNLCIGVPFEYRWTPHYPEPNMQDGTSADRMKTVSEVWARVVNTADLNWRVEQTDGDPLEGPILMRDAADPVADGPLIQDGDFYASLSMDNNRHGLFSLWGDGGFPCQLLMCKIALEVNDS